jgi:hypothetical protein
VTALESSTSTSFNPACGAIVSQFAWLRYSLASVRPHWVVRPPTIDRLDIGQFQQEGPDGEARRARPSARALTPAVGAS